MQVRRIVDLSVPIGPDTQVYPGDPQPRLTPHATLHRDGYNLLALHLGSQTGTHVDAPYHVRADGTRVDALDLALCTGPATVLDVSGAPPRTPITADRIGDRIGDCRTTHRAHPHRLGPPLRHARLLRPPLPAPRRGAPPARPRRAHLLHRRPQHRPDPRQFPGRAPR